MTLRLNESGDLWLVNENAQGAPAGVQLATAAELKAALAADGKCVVPVEPSEAMTVAGGAAWMLSHTSSMSRRSAANIYRAMLAAQEAHDD